VLSIDKRWGSEETEIIRPQHDTFSYILENEMATLDDYETLVAIMETGSLTAAAWRLGRSLQSFRIALLL
jgi:hypothetical protein